jgi:hydrogenase maturation protease
LSGPAPVLVLGVGNPSRGDDALGPRFVEALARALADEIASGALELATDFQLQPEHALDLVGRTQVVFVDASVDAPPPFRFGAVTATSAGATMSHALAPGAVLETYRRVYGAPPPAAVLAIRGERFELGAPLTPRAAGHLAAALRFFLDALAPGADPTARRRRRIEVEGEVGGVGLRAWIVGAARGLGLVGTVGHTRGGLAIDATGPARALDALLAALPSHAVLDAARVHDLPLGEAAGDGFAIVDGAPGGDGPIGHGLAPDLALCAACAADVTRAGDRHRGYAFTSCAACGPRLAIATALPYDRGATTMARFAPCDACAAASADPHARRFGTQLAACPACGPRLALVGRDGAVLDDGGDPLAAAATRLVAGERLAVQGAGGFAVVSDATRAAAGGARRAPPARTDAPPVVLVATLEDAAALVELEDAGRAALATSGRPIVVAPVRAGTAPAALAGRPELGVVLPHSALEHLLVAAVARPLAIDVARVDGGPAVIDRDDALARLGPQVDALLVSELTSARAVEPSLVRQQPAAPGGLRVVRRSRGFAPRPLRLAAPAPQPILAVGGQDRACACVVIEDRAYLTPHLGAIATAAAAATWQRAVEDLEALLGVVAPVVAHDPDGADPTTRYALARAAARRFAVAARRGPRPGRGRRAPPRRAGDRRGRRGRRRRARAGRRPALAPRRDHRRASHRRRRRPRQHPRRGGHRPRRRPRPAPRRPVGPAPRGARPRGRAARAPRRPRRHGPRGPGVVGVPRPRPGLVRRPHADRRSDRPAALSARLTAASAARRARSPPGRPVRPRAPPAGRR